MSQRLLAVSGLAIIIVLFLIFFRQFFWFRPIEDLVTLALEPIQGKLYPGSQAIDRYLSKRQSLQDLETENVELQKQLETLLNDNSRLHQTLDELKMSREEREFLEKTGYQFVQGKVIGRTSDAVVEEIIISVGTSNGVREGFAVVGERGMLIGKVVEAQVGTAKVTLITDSRSEVAASIQNENNSPGLIVGQNGLSLEMQLIPQNEIVLPDQTVITSGLENNIPPGLVIGTIQTISVPPGEIFQRAGLRSLVDYQRIGIISVIIPSPAE